MIFTPLMLEEIIMMMSATNLFRKEGTIKITINTPQWVLTLQNINSKTWMLISSRTSLGKEKNLYGIEKFLKK